jgi:CBS domain-containing protein
MLSILRIRKKPIRKAHPHPVTTESQKTMRKVPRVKDVMTKSTLILTPDMIIRDAAKNLMKKHVFAAPVVDPDGNFIGMFSQQSCMVGLVDAVYNEVPLPLNVGDYLEPEKNTLTITEDAPIMTAVSKFVESNHLILSLPVLRDGKVVGLIARKDVIRTFFEITANIPDAKQAILYISALEKGRQDSEKLR